MNHFALDASAMVKYYVPEPGASLVEHIFLNVIPERLYCLNVGALEALSVIVRARNDKRISADDARRMIVRLHWEVFFGAVHIIPAETELVFRAAVLVETHSINSTDATLLRAALDLHAVMSGRGDGIVLVASDTRLLKAAQAEALPTYNPETGDLPALQALIEVP